MLFEKITKIPHFPIVAVCTGVVKFAPSDRSLVEQVESNWLGYPMLLAVAFAHVFADSTACKSDR